MRRAAQESDALKDAVEANARSLLERRAERLERDVVEAAKLIPTAHVALRAQPAVRAQSALEARDERGKARGDRVRFNGGQKVGLRAYELVGLSLDGDAAVGDQVPRDVPGERVRGT